MSYQRIVIPSPRSTRYPFAGTSNGTSGVGCVSCGAAFALLGLGAGEAAGGKTVIDTTGTVGPVGGLLQLEIELKELATDVGEAWGIVPFNQSLYDRLRRRAAGGADLPLTSTETKQFVLGSVVRATTALVRAKQLALMPDMATTRGQNIAAQHALVTSARELVQTAMREVQSASARAGTSGLGVAWVPILVAIVITAIVVGGGGLAYWAVQNDRLDTATELWRASCASAGGCDAAQLRTILRDLSVPAVEGGIADAIRSGGEGVKTVIIVAGIAGGLLLAGWAYMRYRNAQKWAPMRRSATSSSASAWK